MGGSSGGWYRSNTPGKTLLELKREQNHLEKQREYEREVNDLLNSLLRELNSRDSEQISKHLETIKQALQKDEEGEKIDGFFEMRYGGSVSKHTYADGLSDIDMLVHINRSDLAKMKPREILEKLASRISRRLPNTTIKVGNLAVTVKFSSGHEIQLLPSIKTATGNKIPKPGLNEWSNVVKPHKFAKKLTEVNQANGGKVVPIIKIFKTINATLPDFQKLNGYHIESLAIEAFKASGEYPRTYKGMLEHFCKFAEKAVLEPIKERTGQSVHVDEYLKGSNSLERKRANHTIKMIGKRISQADSARSLTSWKDILDI